MKRYRGMTTAQLDELLQAELRKDLPDEEVVLPILEILKEREQKPRRKNRWIISAAAAAAVLVLLITILPKTVGANSFWNAMLHVTDSIVQFFAPGDSPDSTEAEYVFETDNPGLQQMYDKVVSLGITDPVVPMWLPEGYELAELKSYSYDGWHKLFSAYQSGSNKIVITYKISERITSTQYEGRNDQAEVYEKGRTGHVITKNGDNWTVSWVKNGIESMITSNVSKEDLYNIIQSIYGRNLR